MKKKILLVLITAIVLLIITGRIVLLNLLNQRYHETKASFSDSEITLIADKLNIEAKKIMIHEMKYVHSQDKIFTFDISLEDIEAIENNYTYNGKADEKELYINKNDSCISCTILKENSEYKGEFRIDKYDKDLEAIAKEK